MYWSTNARKEIYLYKAYVPL